MCKPFVNDKTAQFIVLIIHLYFILDKNFNSWWWVKNQKIFVLQGNSVTYTTASSVMKAVRLKLYHNLTQFREQISSKKGLNFDSEMQQKLDKND